MCATLSSLLCLLIASVGCFGYLDFKAHDYQQMTSILTKWNATRSNRPLYWNLSSIGNSVNGENLWSFEISAAPRNKTGIPNVKFIADMHKYHTGKEVLLHFIELLMSSYGKDKNITRLLDTTRIFVLPCINPNSNKDGTNARKIDLNTNFPDYYHPNPQPIQPETEAIMNFMDKIPFTLSANLDGGRVVAYYPFNSLKEYHSFQGRTESLAVDNDVFVYLAKLYSNTHTTMHLGEPCEDIHGQGNIYPSYEGGIANGANTSIPGRDSPTGTMQDYNYFKHGSMELHLKISCPYDDKIERIWDENRNALVQYSLQANRGVHGIIKDMETGVPVMAKLSIEGRDMDFNTTREGEFWRILLPGTYKLKVNSDGYYQEIVPFTIEDTGDFPELVHLHVALLNSSISTTSVTIQTSDVTDDISTIISTSDAVDLDGPQFASVRASAGREIFNISLLLLNVCFVLIRFFY